MFELSKLFTFEASHQLPNHDGKCARLHGHSWRLKVTVKGDVIIPFGHKAGMLMDYSDLKAVVKPLVDQHLDHWHLNDSTGLINPTSEALAKWIYDRLLPELPSLHSITLYETCTSECVYFGGSHV